MINTIKSLGLAVFLATILLSFTSNILPSNGAEFKVDVKPTIEGTYTGVLTYLGSGGKMVSNMDGTAKITKNDTAYDIAFSNDVPSLKGLIFKDGDGTYASISSKESVSGIDLEGGDLTIAVLHNGNNWAFTGEK